MANYLLLYHGGGMGKTDGERNKILAAWNEWMKQCGDNLVDAGNPCATSKNVTKNGDTDINGDKVTGYSVIKAGSMDDAIKAAKMVPLVVDGTGSCDVYETFAAM